MYTTNSNDLYHYGIPGMKWGVRRAQNSNGSYAPAASSSRSSGSSSRKGIDKRKLARNIALGVGAAAAIGGAAYGIHRLRKSGKMPQSLSERMKDDAAALKKARKQYLRNRIYEVGDFSNVANSPDMIRSYARDYDVNRAKTIRNIASVAAVPVAANFSYKIRKSGNSKRSRRGKH